MIEMHLADISPREFKDASECSKGSSVSVATVSNLNERAIKASIEKAGDVAGKLDKDEAHSGHQVRAQWRSQDLHLHQVFHTAQETYSHLQALRALESQGSAPYAGNRRLP